ncbi:plastocyanin/azurin family copper-binding protein [Roseibacillus ishigakijimensis]|nr:plastocyanin/azurin family copper-binding protein [Roseibacillus ishigakijimensis]
MIATGVALAAQMSVVVAEEAKEAAAAEVKAADQQVTIAGDDTMKFDTAEFTVKEGETVALTFKNVGKLPKIAMGHNIVILQPGTEPMSFAAASMVNKDTTGLPKDEALLAKVVASTKMLGPGEEASVTFTAPAPGEYPYICSFPGHAALMKGVMKVEAK